MEDVGQGVLPLQLDLRRKRRLLARFSAPWCIFERKKGEIVLREWCRGHLSACLSFSRPVKKRQESPRDDFGKVPARPESEVK